MIVRCSSCGQHYLFKFTAFSTRDNIKEYRVQVNIKSVRSIFDLVFFFLKYIESSELTMSSHCTVMLYSESLTFDRNCSVVLLSFSVVSGFEVLDL